MLCEMLSVVLSRLLALCGPMQYPYPPPRSAYKSTLTPLFKRRASALSLSPFQESAAHANYPFLHPVSNKARNSRPPPPRNNVRKTFLRIIFYLFIKLVSYSSLSLPLSFKFHCIRHYMFFSSSDPFSRTSFFPLLSFLLPGFFSCPFLDRRHQTPTTSVHLLRVLSGRQKTHSVPVIEGPSPCRFSQTRHVYGFILIPTPIRIRFSRCLRARTPASSGCLRGVYCVNESP
ncbi:hypothetical protein BDZ97DRAFT_96334 [Flammula alnicola]|nr:hypothetical protein BDZ97DRAFT_96334 [Flammula alnicola]